MGKLSGNITGLPALQKKIAGLGPKMAKPANKKAMNIATRIVYTKVRELTPVDKGNLKKSQGRAVRVRRNADVVTGKVGPRKEWETFDAKGNRIYPSNYAHLVEYGHGGPHPAPPHPFMRPAWAVTQIPVMVAFIRILSQELQRYVASNRKP